MSKTLLFHDDMDMQNRIFNGNLIKNGGTLFLFVGIHVLWTPPSCLVNVNMVKTINLTSK
jgi:hypothetical protein